MIVGIVEAAVADLLVLDEVDAQARAAGNDEGARLGRRDDEVGARAAHRSASDAAFSSLVGSGARLSSASQ